MARYFTTVFLIVFSIIGLSSLVYSAPADSTKRQVGVPGGYFPVDVNSPDVKKMAHFATKAIQEKRNVGPIRLARINAASIQIVAGKKYKFSLELITRWRTISCEAIVFVPLKSSSMSNPSPSLSSSSCTPRKGR